MSRVMLATECSEPQVMKAKRHQKTMMSYAASFVVLKEHHTARQTRILQRMPHMKSRTKAVLILPAAAVERKAEVASAAYMHSSCLIVVFETRYEQSVMRCVALMSRSPQMLGALYRFGAQDGSRYLYPRPTGDHQAVSKPLSQNVHISNLPESVHAAAS